MTKNRIYYALYGVDGKELREFLSDYVRGGDLRGNTATGERPPWKGRGKGINRWNFLILINNRLTCRITPPPPKKGEKGKENKGKGNSQLIVKDDLGSS
jgi:hypothetical protein